HVTAETHDPGDRFTGMLSNVTSFFSAGIGTDVVAVVSCAVAHRSKDDWDQEDDDDRRLGAGRPGRRGRGAGVAAMARARAQRRRPRYGHPHLAADTEAGLDDSDRHRLRLAGCIRRTRIHL